MQSVRKCTVVNSTSHNKIVQEIVRTPKTVNNLGVDTVIEQAPGIGVVMGLRRRELLDQLGIPFQWADVQRRKLPTRKRCSLPYVFQQLLPARRRQ